MTEHDVLTSSCNTFHHGVGARSRALSTMVWPVSAAVTSASAAGDLAQEPLPWHWTAVRTANPYRSALRRGCGGTAHAAQVATQRLGACTAGRWPGASRPAYSQLLPTWVALNNVTTSPLPPPSTFSSPPPIHHTMSQQPQSRVAPDVHPAGGGVVSNEEREYTGIQRCPSPNPDDEISGPCDMASPAGDPPPRSADPPPRSADPLRWSDPPGSAVIRGAR